jgi:hypothetical protein
MPLVWLILVPKLMTAHRSLFFRQPNDAIPRFLRRLFLVLLT